MKHRDFDVIVVGGGHAGTEAAHAAARRGAHVGLVTLNWDGIGVMSCNPAIGGLGKGHLVREIDALDGVMGGVSDSSGIQFRLLNRRKGPAVQGPRAQADRALYRSGVQNAIRAHPRISVVEGEVVDFLTSGPRVCGVKLADDSEISSAAVILTTGTFLRGVIHIGDMSRPGGRIGDQPSNRLAKRIDAMGLPLGRLKTGTPPRLKSRSINWDILERQAGDEDPVFFSFLSSSVAVRQVSCGITHTNDRTHEIIRQNLEQSAMYGGLIEGVGPRYCPSIEDKVVRFADKQSHQIFLEPEGLSSDLVYPNGISTSLPASVQEAYVRSIKGLENAEIEQLGYAIEYDYVDPRSLNSSLQVADVPGLYFAGQINGTTGYEEAAAQGLVAGVNAAATALDLSTVVFAREQSYIGVMIDDLITRGVSEPYRMFTSRAEYRLSLRADNADQRLTPLGIQAGIVGEGRRRAFARKMEMLETGKSMLLETRISPSDASAVGIQISTAGAKRTAFDLLSFADVQFSDLLPLSKGLSGIDPTVRDQLKTEALYSQYEERQRRDIELLKRDEAHSIPPDFAYEELSGLSKELQEKLKRIRPETLGQAGRVEGMTPAGLTLILAKLRQRERKLA